jgi:hypothetical protein
MRATCGMILRVNCLFLRPETGLIQLLIIKRFFPDATQIYLRLSESHTPSLGPTLGAF